MTRRDWPVTKRPRIVELTFPAGASVVEIARSYEVHPNIVHHWRRPYRVGKLDAQLTSKPQLDSDAMSAMFIAVHVVPAAHQSRLVVQGDTPESSTSVKQVMFSSGSTLRIESAAIDAALVCAVVAELRR